MYDCNSYNYQRNFDRRLGGPHRYPPARHISRPFPRMRRDIHGRPPFQNFKPFPRSSFPSNHNFRNTMPVRNMDFQNNRNFLPENFERQCHGCIPQEMSHSPERNEVVCPEIQLVQTDRENFENLWFETSTQDGKPYFYNAITRKVRWDRPENVEILNQSQIKSLPSVPASGSDIHNSWSTVQTNALEAPPIFCVPIHPVQGEELNSGIRMFAPPVYREHPPVRLIPHYQFGHPPPPFGLFVQGIQSSFPAPFITGPQILPVVETGTSGQPEFGNPISQPQWSVHETNNGQQYFYNNITKTSTWDTPFECTDDENSDGTVNNGSGISAASDNANNDKQEDADELNTIPMEADTTNMSENEIIPEADEDGSGTVPDSEIDITEKETSGSDVVDKRKDNTRPVSSTPVPGTVWTVVWTGDDKVFFFNTSLRSSVWNMPLELENRADVEKMIQKKPKIISEINQKAKASEDSCSDSKKLKLSNFSDYSAKEDKPTSEEENMLIETKDNESNDLEQKKDLLPLEVRIKLFKEMLAEKNVSAYSTWAKELHKIVFDTRYKLLTSKERKQVFDAYMCDRVEDEKNERRAKLKKLKDNYVKLLVEAGVSPKTRFSDFTDKYGRDERFKAVETFRERELFFDNFISEARKKEREVSLKYDCKSKKKFLELLEEQKLDGRSKWSDVERKLENDERYKALNNDLRVNLFKEHVRKLSENKEKDKQERIDASIRLRKETVNRDMRQILKEREREREMHKHDESVQYFKDLLCNYVTNPCTTWHEAKKLLKRDTQFVNINALDKAERDLLFEEHISYLVQKRKKIYCSLLDEIPNLNLTSKWKDMKKIVMVDKRCTNFSTSERKCEREFKNYLRNRFKTAKEEFRDLLKETKIITYKSKDLMETSNHLADIKNVLQNDKRYLILNCAKEEREEILFSYIHLLHRQGPPPPPTATEPKQLQSLS